MNLNKIEQKINELFSDHSSRQIVFWYDEKGEFKDDIKNIVLDNAILYILDENSSMHAEYYIEVEFPNTNFLVYAPFSQPDDDVNVLADMIHYSKVFTADWMELIVQRLHMSRKLIPILKKHDNFWKANSRLEAFEKLNINDYNENNINLGILSVLTNQKILDIEHIMRAVICEELEDENKYIIEFKKYNILNEFWQVIGERYGYTEDNPTVEKLIIFLLLNYTADLFTGSTPKSWDTYLIDNKNNSRVFVDEFMNNSHYSNIYDKLALNVESKFIETKINTENTDSYKYCDTVKFFDTSIINHYIDLLITNKVELGEEFKELLKMRQKTHYYNEYEDYYLLTKYANLFIGLFNKFEKSEIPNIIEDIIKVYSSKWVLIDTYYRKFYYHYDRLYNIDNVEELRQLIENMYNVFLSTINPEFTSKLTEQPLERIGISKQWNFYKENIPHSVRKHKTVVIISDAFRYGCAEELYDILENDPKTTPNLSPMLSTIPSYTSLGMASLLPNKSISYDGNTVLIGDNKTRTTSERQDILHSYTNINTLAIQYEDIDNLNSQELKELIKGVNLVYIYHNKIDSIGDKTSSQNDVFNAVSDTIDDMVELINKLRSTASISSFFITADHGFIYKRDKLDEKDKVDLNGIKEVITNKRYIISEKPLELDSIVSIPLDYLDTRDELYVNVPLGVDVFKTPGSGLNFVHGGGSLEECIVPLLHVEAARGARNQRKVELELIKTNRKITNYETMLTFLQKENISQDVLSLEAAISFEDEDGKRISNEVIIYADKNSQYAEDREFKEKFTLYRRQYSKSKNYYLIIKDNQDDIEVARYDFIIDIAFQDDFDF